MIGKAVKPSYNRSNIAEIVPNRIITHHRDVSQPTKTHAGVFYTWYARMGPLAQREIHSPPIRPRLRSIRPILDPTQSIVPGNAHRGLMVISGGNRLP